MTSPTAVDGPDRGQIELIVQPTPHWFVDGPPTDGDEDEDGADEQDGLTSTVTQRGVVRRVQELVAQYPATEEGPSIAILVGSWRRADFYRDLLQAYGLRSAVQGGRGLLKTEEVNLLLLWLEALIFSRADIALVGVVRGPGVAISDAGLYCLRMGHGVSELQVEPSYRLRVGVLHADFNADAAVAEWRAASTNVDSSARAVLSRDVEGLATFWEVWEWAAAHVGVIPTSLLFGELLDRLALWSYWHSQPGGRQAVANLRTFLDVVRDAESAVGTDAHELFRVLTDTRENADPAAGGLEASGGAPIVITTYWQAKGLEWPVVVLPDVDKTGIRGDERGFAPARIQLDDDEGTILVSPEARRSDPRKPLDTKTTAVSSIVDQYRRPAERAELRRLLYVAMTRAKERVVISGTFSVPLSKSASQVEVPDTLHDARNWGSLIRICSGLSFDAETRTASLRADTAWGELQKARILKLSCGAQLARELERPDFAVREASKALPTAAAAKRWSVVVANPRRRRRPSDARVDVIPTPSSTLSSPLPIDRHVRETPFAQPADEGTAFHGLMETLGYSRSGDVAHIAGHVLRSLRLDTPEDHFVERIDALVDLYDHAVRETVLFAELCEAAAAGRVLHEVPLQFRDEDGVWVEGVVDLLWVDGAGDAHLIDYKTGWRHPTESEPLGGKLAEHFAQVSLYARGCSRLGVRIRTFGVWYVAGGCVLRWDVEQSVTPMAPPVLEPQPTPVAPDRTSWGYHQMTDKDTLSFEELLSRADSALLQDFLSKPAVRLLSVLEERGATASRLRSTLLAIRSPQELLEDRTVRAELTDLLRPAEADELAKRLGLSGDVFGALGQMTLSRGSRKHGALLAFFGLEPPTTDATPPPEPRVDATPHYALFAHQRAAVRKIEKYFARPDARVLLHMPTGSGKTRTSMSLICEHLRKHEPTNVIWLATSEELCEQAAQEFEKAWRLLGDRKVTVHRYWGGMELQLGEKRDGFIVAGLQKVYAAAKQNPGSVASLGDVTSLIVVDEAHQSIAETYRLVIDVLFSRRPGRSSLLGLTATPGRSWADIDADLELARYFDQNKVTLEIPGYDNPIEYLFDEGYLARPEFIPVEWDSELTASDRERIADALEIPNDILRRLAQDEFRNLQVVQEVESAIKRHRRILLFAATVEHAELLAAVLQARGVPARSVTGKTPSESRRGAIEWFKNADPEPRVLANFGVLTTGFDAPQTSCAIIGRPTKSLVLYSQMVGRATRGVRAGGNNAAQIITVVDTGLPGFRDLTEAFTNWEDVWSGDQHE